MAPIPFTISGTIWRGEPEAYASTTFTAAGAGQTLDFGLSDATSKYEGATVTITNNTAGTSTTIDTDANGNYSKVLEDVVGDSITVSVSSITDTSDTLEMCDENHALKSFHSAANAYKQVLVDKRGDEFGHEHPFPVFPIPLLNGTLGPTGNYKSTISPRGDGQPDFILIEYRNGDQYKMTFSYNGNNIQTGQSFWEKQ